MKKLVFITIIFVLISLFFINETYSFQFGFGTKGFIRKILDVGQQEGKISKMKEEKEQGKSGGVPAAPSNLYAIAISSSLINLTWQDNSTNEEGFKIERKTGAGGTYIQIATVNANVTSYSDIGLTANTTYYYRVRAYNSAGDSDYSNEASTTTLASTSVPVAPSNLSATAVSSSRIDLFWQDNSTNEEGFKIERKTGAGGTYIQIATVNANVTSYSDIGLTANTTYYYRVRAYNSAGDSDYSNEASTTTLTAYSNEVSTTTLTPGTILWTKQWGSSEDDIGLDVAVDGFGNIYVTGYTKGGLDGNPIVGWRDIFLTKFDSSGNKLWMKQWGADGDDYGFDVAVDGSGNIYVTGRVEDEFARDIFLTKFDSSGNKLWTKQWGGSDSLDEGFGVAVDSFGNIYVTGYTHGGLDGNTNAGGWDIFLTKFDSSGNKLWTKQWGTEWYDSGFDVAVDGFGNIYVTGFIHSGYGISAGGSEGDIFLAKFDSSGNELWTKQWGTDGEDCGYAISVDGFGNIYVTGFTNDGLDGNTNAGRWDIFLTKYNSSGNKIWTRQWGTNLDDLGFGVAVDGFGNIYVTGYTPGELDGNTNAGYSDIFLTKFDSSGNKIWTKQWGTNLDDLGFGVSVDGSGNIYVTGSTTGELDGNTNAGSSDIFLTKFAP